MTRPAVRRAEVAQAIGTYLVTPSFRRYIKAHPNTRDSDGEAVILAHAPDESIQDVLTAAAPHDHAVMLATLVDDHVFVCILGATVRPGTPISEAATPIHTDASTTVADLARMLLPLGEGEDFVLTYQAAPLDQRVLVGST